MISVTAVQHISQIRWTLCEPTDCAATFSCFLLCHTCSAISFYPLELIVVTGLLQLPESDQERDIFGTTSVDHMV